VAIAHKLLQWFKPPGRYSADSESTFTLKWVS